MKDTDVPIMGEILPKGSPDGKYSKTTSEVVKLREKRKLFNRNKNGIIKKLPTEIQAIILRKINENYVKIGDKKISETDTSFTFLKADKQVTFPVPENIEIVYSDKKHNYIFYDFDSGILNFKKNELPLGIKELDLLLTKNAVAGIFSRIRAGFDKPNIMGNAFKYIIVLVAGLAIGYIIAEAIHGNPQPTTQIMGVAIKWLI